MLSRLKPICYMPMSNITRTLPTSRYPQISKTYATYHVDKTNPLNSSHELTKSNPILPNSKGQPFQHPSIGKDICKLQDCEHKKCDELCAPLKEKTYIGHATHDGQRPDSRFVSEKDLNGQNRPQYAKFYEYPKPNYDHAGQNIDQNKTTVLNDNKEISSNIHMNSSRNLTQYDNTLT